MLTLFSTFQNHPWIKKSETEDVDIAGWVCKTMEITPPAKH